MSVSARLRPIALPILTAVSVAASGVYLWVLWRHGLLDTYLDHAEPAVAARAWRLVAGRDLYGAPDAADWQLTGYGPILFLADALFLTLAGGSIAASKLAGTTASLLAVALLAWHAARRFGWRTVPVVVVVTLGGMLHAGPMAFWNRPEPHIILAVTLALVVAARPRGEGKRRPGLVDALVVGACIGYAMGTKINAVIYFVPIVLGFLTDRRWPIQWSAIAASGVLVLLLPFAHPLIGLENWAHGLRDLVADRQPDWGALPGVLRHGAAVYLSPLLLAPFARTTLSRSDWIYLGAVLVVGVVAGFLALSPGAGWYYMLPLLPMTVDLVARLLPRDGDGRPAVMAVLVAAFVVLAWTPQKRLMRSMDRLALENPGAEIAAVLARHPGATVEMGLGDDVETYRHTWPWARLAFAGHPATTASWSDMESTFLGRPAPPAKLARIAACATDLWLIPAGEEPFAMASYYPGHPAYWPEFRDAFLLAYEKQESGQSFDLWSCKKKQ